VNRIPSPENRTRVARLSARRIRDPLAVLPIVSGVSTVVKSRKTCYGNYLHIELVTSPNAYSVASTIALATVESGPTTTEKAVI
jgi:hypothetical protein